MPTIPAMTIAFERVFVREIQEGHRVCSMPGGTVAAVVDGDCGGRVR
jgi:hypothetical protein